MDGKINARVVPGDVVGRITAEQEVLRLGGGLVQDNENVIATKAGILRFKAPNKYWVENTQRRVRCSQSSSNDTLIERYLLVDCSID